MSILSGLYTLIIGPLKLLFEVIFSITYFITNSPGLSIIALSLIMNVLLLPLYRKADSIQFEENEKEKQMKPFVDHIKKAFKGDERYMILQTYYRQNNYKSINVLKGSISLLLEIPFFIAAYDFLSNLIIFNNASFGPIMNLSKQDGLLNLYGISINILPITMTIINIISSIIYTKGMPARSKIQLYLMAILFLVLLYDSPSALVLYWTLNNLFSLFKNIFIRIKNSKLIIYITMGVVGIGGLVYVLLNPMSTAIKQLVAIVFMICLMIPILIFAINKKKHIRININYSDDDKKMFYIATFLLTIVLGLFIPSNVIKASPSEFVDSVTLLNPIYYIVSSFLLSMGTFIIWINVFNYLSSNEIKKFLSIAMIILCGVVMIDYLFFGTNFGTLTHKLKYENEIVILTKDYLINIVSILAISFALIFVNYKYTKILKIVLCSSMLALIIISGTNMLSVNKEYSYTKQSLIEARNNPLELNLSKEGENVVVIMLDRAISTYVPYILNENDKLINQFSGFTFYPNAVSFGTQTNTGTPGLYGGYEYIPEEMNKRDDLLLSEKQNEALKIMPVNFNNIGYDVTVCNPTYAGYKEPADLSIYSDYPNIKTYLSDSIVFDTDTAKLDSLHRNLFCFSITKSVPLVLFNSFYNHGYYYDLNSYAKQYIETGSTLQQEMNYGFTRCFNVLHNFYNYTKINDSKGSFIMLANDITHCPTFVEEPNYIPFANDEDVNASDVSKERISIDGKKLLLEDNSQISHYQIEASALIQLGNWFDYLREQDVYDNTKIILVSDHGFSLKHYGVIEFEDSNIDLMEFNCLLLVKDFNSTGFNIDNSLMTNADVPYLAFKDVIDQPKNMFTNNIIDIDAKNADELHLFKDYVWEINVDNGNTFIPGSWYSVHDNIFEEDNWKEITNQIKQ